MNAYKAHRDEINPNGGYYNGRELAGLKIAEMDDDIADLRARLAVLEFDRAAALVEFES